MEKIIVIVTKNGIKYTIGIDKSVSEILNEIRVCEGAFYQIIDSCAILKDDILSVEQFEIHEEQQEEVKAND